MQNQRKRGGFTPQENLISILPSIVAGIFILSTTVIIILLYFSPQNEFLKIGIILYGTFGSLYLAFYYFLYTASLNKSRFSWINSIVSALALGSLVFLVPEKIDNLIFTLLFIASLTSSLISSRGPAYILALGVTSIYFIVRFNQHLASQEWVTHIGLTIAALVAIETIQQLKNIAREQINRLEVINELSKQIVSTLETDQVFTLLNAAFQNAVEADSYYIGIVEGEEISLKLLYDDGEYFFDVRAKRKGTLSNWVITHQQELFLPDLRQDIQLEDVENIIIGQQKTALSWMGVPMHGLYVNGIIAISSYHPNAFDRSDMELLSTIAQRAALALDNTYQHALVEEQARLDSLTRVYNHGYFIQTLHDKAQDCLSQHQPLSLIMLDIDHFKQYNDLFGHLIGDETLVRLCDIIRSHIKSTDAVGRWGGEEFAISLPNTDGNKAMQVARRIQETMASINIHLDNGSTTIPIPTISMGIAVFPTETEEITKLIDLADKRLYIAKERGRNQIEPAHTFWEIAK